MPVIYIVEDDLAIQASLADILRTAGYDAEVCGTLEEARRLVKARLPSLMLLDVVLPDGNGVAFCEELRRSNRFPVLFLTCRGEEEDIVAGLAAGGDDYLTKPYRMKELLARVQALLRRTAPDRLCAGGFLLDTERQSATFNGEPVDLTPTEFKLLRELMKSPGEAVPRARLLEAAWDSGDPYIVENTLSVHMSRLREKTGGADCPIKTARGLGYILEDTS